MRRSSLENRYRVGYTACGAIPRTRVVAEWMEEYVVDEAEAYVEA